MGRRTLALVASCGVAVLLATATDGSVATVGTDTKPLVVGTLPPATGPLVYEADLAGDGAGFGERYVIGDPSASAVRFMKGSVEYAVVKPGGNTGNNPEVVSLRRYFAQIVVSVVPGSNVEFWFNLGPSGAFKNIGSHLIAVHTFDEVLQFGYFVQDQDVVYLGSPVSLDGLQSGRSFTIAALVDPPDYQVYVDGRSVVNVHHTPNPPLQAPSFGVFSDATGSVRLSAILVYKVA